MQRHSIVINAETCLVIPTKTNSISSYHSPLQESCQIDTCIAEESEYQYPFLLLCGDIHLHTNSSHPSEERNRFRSESRSGSISESNVNVNVLSPSPSSLVERVVDTNTDTNTDTDTTIGIDLEVTQATTNGASTTAGAAAAGGGSTSSFTQLPPKIRLNSPFVGLEEDDDDLNLDLMPEMCRDGSHASSDAGGGGVRRVWQCALLGLPFEMTIEDLYCFLEPYVHDICRVAVVQVPEEEEEGKREGDDGRATHTRALRNAEFAAQFVGNYKTCIIDFTSKGPMLSFCALYNDLHFPSHTSIPPCVTLQIADLSIEHPPSSSSITDTDVDMDELHRHQHADSITSTSSRVAIPACAVCIRRLSRTVSGVHTASSSASSASSSSSSSSSSSDSPLGLLVGPDFVDNGDRCKVCFIYGNAHNSAAVSKSYCQVCGVTENIWCCLQCGYAGCGRYTAQHAKNHFHSAGHPFSLELVTGRIWSYEGDRFVHIDPLSEYLQASPSSSSSSSSSSSCSSSSSSDMLLTSSQSWSGQGTRGGRRSSSPWTGSSGSSSSGSAGGGWGGVCVSKGPRGGGGGEEEEATRRLLDRLDLHTSDKLGSLQHDYDAVLDMQLKDQELYYEKLLARETVLLLETRGYAEYGSDEGSSSLALSSSSGSGSAGRSGGGGGNALSEEDLASIEAMKMEISALEYEYQEQLQELCVEESITASVRQDNNQLMKTQKHLRTLIADRKTRTQEIQEKESEQTAALQQDIRDMEFFIRTSQEMSQAAPAIQSDVRDGMVLIGEGGGGDRKHSNNRSKKGGDKKNKKKR